MSSAARIYPNIIIIEITMFIHKAVVDGNDVRGRDEW